MRIYRAAIILLPLLLQTGPSHAMPFNFLVDDPVAWGCPNLLITVSKKQHGAELFIPDQHVAEAARVPWQKHLESQVHVRMGNDDAISPPIPIHVDTLGTFSVSPKLDREKFINQMLVELRAKAKADEKTYWRIVALARRSARRGRFLILDPVDLHEVENKGPRTIHMQIRGLFTEGVGLQLGESVNVFLLAADPMDGLPPRNEEIALANDIFRFTVIRIEGDPERFPGRHLVTLIKASSVAKVPDLLFLYDPWEDSRNFRRHPRR